MGNINIKGICGCRCLLHIETEWRGSPNLELGSALQSFTRQDKTPVNYECLSNDFTYNGGLKVKTKARKITASE